MSNARFMILRLHVTLLDALIPDRGRRVLLRIFTPHRPSKTYSALSEQPMMTLVLRRMHKPWRTRGRRCLRAGFLSFYFSQRAGIPAELCFGACTNPGPSELAHYWITRRGRCLTEPPQDDYVPILTWGMYGGEEVLP